MAWSSSLLHRSVQAIKGRMLEGIKSLNPNLVTDLVLLTTFSVCTKAD